MTGFIDGHKVRFGVEPICRVLSQHGVQVAPSGYYAFKARTPSKRALSDAFVWERIEALQDDKTKGKGEDAKKAGGKVRVASAADELDEEDEEAPKKAKK